MSTDRYDDRRATGPVMVFCLKCGAAVYETYNTLPWGTRTRLLVCCNPSCGEVAAEPERRRYSLLD